MNSVKALKAITITIAIATKNKLQERTQACIQLDTRYNHITENTENQSGYNPQVKRKTEESYCQARMCNDVFPKRQLWCISLGHTIRSDKRK